MREIKFRWYEEDEKEYYYFSFGDMPDIIHELISIGEQLEIEQYTGLKDKNGKEVFEGDIVNYGDNYPSIVKWTNEGEGGIESCGFYLFEPKHNKEDDYYPRTHTLFAYTNPIEVLGNIHENPELLEANQ